MTVARALWWLAQSEQPPGRMAASAAGKPWGAARRVSEAPQGDGLSVEKETLEVSGEHAARGAFFLGMGIGGLVEEEAAVLGETSAEAKGAESGVLGGVSAVLAEATSAPQLDAVPVPSSDPSCWLS